LSVEEFNEGTTENAIDKMMKEDAIERFFILLSMVVRLTCNSPKKIFREGQTISFQRIFETIPVKLPIEPTRRSVLDRHISEGFVVFKKEDNNIYQSGQQCDTASVGPVEVVEQTFGGASVLGWRARTGAACTGAAW